jgi:hypothetical protein
MIPELKLQPKQIIASEYWVDDTTEEILFGGAKGGTKSFTGSALIFSNALIYPGTHYFIARQNLNDLTKYTTPSIIEVFGFLGIPFEKYVTYNGQNSYFQLYNNSKVFYIDCKYLPSDPEYHRFGSLQFTRGWFEEIGQIDSLAITNLAVSVGRWKNAEYNLKRKILMTCNPNRGYAYNNFYLPFKNGTLPDYRKFIQSLPTDNRYLTTDYLEALNRLPPNERERLLKGNWEYDSDPNTMIEPDIINDMFNNNHVTGGRKMIIVDAARYGSDRAIISVWDDFILEEYLTFNTSSTVDIENAISAMRTKHNITPSMTLVDDDGVGGGIVDHQRCRGFVNNSRPHNSTYDNLKSECAYKLAEKARDIYIKCNMPDKEIEMIKQELSMLKTYQADGR